MNLQNLDTIIAFAVVMLILSLMVMVLVQAIAALLELRGKNLIATLTKLLIQISPELRAKPQVAREIASKVAGYPSLVHFSDKAQGPVGKFLAVFFTRATKGITPEEWINILDELSSDNNAGLSAPAKAALNSLVTATIPGVTPAEIQQAGQIAGLASQQFPSSAQSVKKGIQDVGSETRVIVMQTKKWFDSIMNRSSDWFTTQTRVFTVVIAFLLAIIFRVDSINIIRQLSNNSEARARLVLSADQTLNQTQRSIQPGATPPGDTATVQSSIDTLKNLKGQLDQSQLEILVWPKPPSGSGGSTIQNFLSQWANGQLLLGCVMTGLLLSLGAPFWFNMLSELTSVRPALANQLDGASAAQSLGGVGSGLAPPKPAAADDNLGVSVRTLSNPTPGTISSQSLQTQQTIAKVRMTSDAPSRSVVDGVGGIPADGVSFVIISLQKTDANGNPLSGQADNDELLVRTTGGVLTDENGENRIRVLRLANGRGAFRLVSEKSPKIVTVSVVGQNPTVAPSQIQIDFI